ncbi:SgcJ/EcaC family oxidoreductase [Chitinophaga silvisoli]|uniref:SgcJ/EcaC family oxidoreductase n=1 Tax=Chitinophaga silvisoli TaxID=2291814 RepID=A0A3E1NT71_9BACT|nr:SgcJ/EcaC family oxidoreductase [Chitinophaga silvisoli]RFM31112.1 SgcJ/EcaC family oxidoreductase [Chitinophaga silvisoli]
MRKITLLTLLLFTCYVVNAQQLDTTKEIPAIKQLVQHYEDAWNRHDPQGLADNYDTDATWVNWFGAYYKGREDIRYHYQIVHTSYFKNTQYYTRAIEDVTFLKPDVAIAHVRTGLSGDSRYPGQTFEFRRMIILTKQQGKWLIKAGQNAKLDPGVK